MQGTVGFQERRLVEIGRMYKANEVYQRDLREALGTVKDWERLSGSTFLITGASGMIASFLIDLLFCANETMQTDIRVYAMVRDKTYAERRFRSLLGHSGFHMIVQDVCSPPALEEKADYIIHMAGDGYPEAFRKRPVETMLPALVGTWQLLEYARKWEGTRFLYVSSGEVYGAMEDRGDGFRETDSGYVDPMSSRSCYPSAKRAAETLCVSYFTEYRVDAVAVRPSHVYGPGSSGKDNRASAQFFRDVLEGRDVSLNSEGKQLRSYLYVADCVSALLTVLMKGNGGEAYNVANPESRATIAEFARMTADLGGQKCIFRGAQEGERKEMTPISLAVLNSDKLQELGWRGAYPVSRGIRHTLEIMGIRTRENR